MISLFDPVVFYGCFLVIEAQGGTWFRTPCPNSQRSRPVVLRSIDFYGCEREQLFCEKAFMGIIPLFFLGSSFFWLHNFALPNTFLGTPLVLDIEERRAIVRWKATTEAVITVPGIGRADRLKRPIRFKRCARFTSVHFKPCILTALLELGG